MPTIFDPDSLLDGREIIIDTSAKTIGLRSKTEDGTSNIDDEGATGGVTGQVVYSKLKELWRTDPNYIKFPFPMEAITPEQFEFISGWLPDNDKTRKLIRTAGWAERSAGGALQRVYAGVISLGALGSTDQPYYQQEVTGAPVDFFYTGIINEAVQILGDASNGNFDYRGYFNLFAREPAKTYASSRLADIGVTEMTYIVYRFPLTNADDLNIAASDANISTLAPYTGINITYFAVDQNRTIGASSYPFDVIVEGNGATTQQIYEKVQYLLRQDIDIDTGAGTVNGKTASDLLEFVGDNLRTALGVYIDNFDANFTNSITFTDVNDVQRTFPFVAAGNLQFNGNLVSDPSAVYRMFFSTLPGVDDDFAEINAVIVEDADGIPISGDVTGAASIPFTFAYDSNVQGGRTTAEDADVTVVAIGLSTGQYVVATATLRRAVGQNIALTAPLERTYLNPA